MKAGLKPEEVVNYLNKKCGMLGISGFSSDMRDCTEAMLKGDARARLAIEMVAYRVKKYVGSYIAVLGGVDAIVFTGGIGEHSYIVRKMVMENMDYCGAKFDEKKNEEYSSGVGFINADDSKVKIIVLPTNEELSIARETKILTAK